MKRKDKRSAKQLSAAANKAWETRLARNPNAGTKAALKAWETRREREAE